MCSIHYRRDRAEYHEGVRIMIAHNHAGGHGKHAIFMALCCLIPIIGISLLAVSGVVGGWGYYALILLCPLGHFIMMSQMNRKAEVHQEIEKRRR